MVPDGNGGVYISWSDDRNGNTDIYCQRIDATGAPLWTINGVPVCQENHNQQLIKMLSDQQGGVSYVWSDDRNGNTDIYCQRLNAVGQRLWSASGQIICDESHDQTSADAIAAHAGGLAVAWSDIRNGTNDVYIQYIDGNGIQLLESAGRAVSVGPGEQVTPQLAAGWYGNNIIAWDDERNGNHDIYYQCLDYNGLNLLPINGIRLGNEDHDQIMPKIVGDNAGGAIIAWQDTRNEAPDIYAQRVSVPDAPPTLTPTPTPEQTDTPTLTPTKTYSPTITPTPIILPGAMWRDQGKELCLAPDVQENPQTCADGQGGAITVWQDKRNGNYDLYAQRTNTWGENVWQVNGILVNNSAGDQKNPKIVSDGQNGVMIFWEDNRSGNWDIYGQHIDQNGNLSWLADGVAVCSIIGDQTSLKAVAGLNNTAILAWQDARNDGGDIYTEKIDLSGNSTWVPNGLLVCNAPNIQLEPAIVADETGGIYLVWNDLRSDEGDIYCQKINEVGISQWAVNGVIACAAQFQQTGVDVIGDGNGGIYLSWIDKRRRVLIAGWYYFDDLYGQHINTNGVRVWDDNGLLLYASGYLVHNYSPKMINDGNGNAIIAWDIFNNNNWGYYAYALKVDQNGSIIWTKLIKWSGSINGYSNANSQIVSDNMGGAYIAWDDWRNNNYPYQYGCDVIIQRIKPDGDLCWDSNGIPIANVHGNQTLGCLAVDGNGGALVVWQDNRNDEGDIYIQRIHKPLPIINSIDPSQAIQSLLSGINITGNYFKDDKGVVDQVRLIRPGHSNIIATNIHVADSVSLTCDINLLSAAPGNWTVQVIDTLGQVSLSGPTFTVLEASPTVTPTPSTTKTQTSTPTITTTFSMTPTPTRTPITLPTYEWIREGSGLQIHSADVYDPNIAISLGGIPKVAWYEHWQYPYQASVYVKQYDGITWLQTGGDFSTNQYSYQPDIAFLNDIPFVAYNEPTGTSMILTVYVKRLNGTTWEIVGGAGLNVNPLRNAHYPSIAMSTAGIPYVTWDEYYGGSAQHYKIFVKKLGEYGWSSLAGELNVNAGTTAKSQRIALSQSDTPYVAWSEFDGAHNQIYVKYWDGVSWVSAGGSLNLDPNADASSCDITIAGETPYVAWEEAGKIHVKYWDGINWIILGDLLNMDPLQAASTPRVTIMEGGIVCVTWAEMSGSSEQTFVKGWDGLNWVPLGGSLNIIPSWRAAHPSIATKNGTLYVSWREYGSGQYTINVKRYGPPTYPTPTPSPTPSVTFTATPSETLTLTDTPTDSPTATITPTDTPTPTESPTDTATETVTWTATLTDTPTATPTTTNTETSTATMTLTTTPTPTPTMTLTLTRTGTVTVTSTCTSSRTPTPSATPRRPQQVKAWLDGCFILEPNESRTILAISLYKHKPQPNITLHYEVVKGSGRFSGSQEAYMVTGPSGEPAQVVFTASGKPFDVNIVKVDNLGLGGRKYLLLLVHKHGCPHCKQGKGKSKPPKYHEKPDCYDNEEEVEAAAVEVEGELNKCYCDHTATPTSTIEPTAIATPTPLPTATMVATAMPTKTYTATPYVQANQIITYPNPAKDRVNFAYTVQGAAKAEIDIYRLTGERVAHIVENRNGGAGQTLTTAWDAANVAPGIYLCRIKITDVNGKIILDQKKKIALLK